MTQTNDPGNRGRDDVPEHRAPASSSGDARPDPRTPGGEDRPVEDRTRLAQLPDPASLRPPPQADPPPSAGGWATAPAPEQPAAPWQGGGGPSGFGGPGDPGAYGSSGQGAGGPGGYGPPAHGGYGQAAQSGYAPGPQAGYAPGPQAGYGPGGQAGYGPSGQPGFGPGGPGGYGQGAPGRSGSKPPWLIPVLLVAALVIVGGGVGLFFLLSGDEPEDVAEDMIERIFDGDCAGAWELIAPQAQAEIFGGSQDNFCQANQLPPEVTDPEVTGSRVIDEGQPTIVEVTITGVPAATSLELEMVEVDDDWLVNNLNGGAAGQEGQVPDIDAPELPELPDLPTSVRVGARG